MKKTFCITGIVVCTVIPAFAQVQPNIIKETSTIRFSEKKLAIKPEGRIEISRVDERGEAQYIVGAVQYFKSEFAKGYIPNGTIKQSDIEYNETGKEFKDTYELLLDEAGGQHCVCTRRITLMSNGLINIRLDFNLPKENRDKLKEVTHVFYFSGTNPPGNTVKLTDNDTKTIVFPEKPEAWKPIVEKVGNYEIEFSPENQKNNFKIASANTAFYCCFNPEGQIQATIKFAVSQQLSFNYTIDIRGLK
jgi:hypothetical protein